MLRVDSSKPCQIIYAVCRHEYLSYVLEPHIVQLNPNGEFSLTYQRLFSNTAQEFKHFLDETDFKLIKLMEEEGYGSDYLYDHDQPDEARADRIRGMIMFEQFVETVPQIGIAMSSVPR